METTVQRQIEKDMEELLDFHARLPLLPSELVSAALISYVRRTRTPKWLTRFPSTLDFRNLPESQWWTDLPWGWTASEVASSRSFHLLSEWLGAVSVYKLPQAVLTTLAAWGRGQYEMKLLHELPSPYDVLEFQIRGVRPISLLLDPEVFWLPVERFSNAFELMIHDLIHGDRFHREPEMKLAQMQFFRLLKSIVDEGILSSFLEEDEKLRADFEYVLSDMNTSPVHGLLYLKAILIQFFSRRHAQAGVLAGKAKVEFEALFQKTTLLWAFSKRAVESFDRMCTPEYQARDDGLILHHEVLAWRPVTTNRERSELQCHPSIS